MYLNPKLLGSVLSCVSLGPAVVPCSVAYQIFWDLVIRIDVPFPQGERMICLMLKSVITGKIFKTLAKTVPVCPSVKLLSPTNLAWIPCTSFQGLPVLFQQRKVLLQQITVFQLSFLESEMFLHFLIFPILINPALIK